MNAYVAYSVANVMKAVTVSLEEEVADRVADLADILETSNASVVRRALKRALPELEREVAPEGKNGGKTKKAA